MELCFPGFTGLSTVSNIKSPWKERKGPFLSGVKPLVLKIWKFWVSTSLSFVFQGATQQTHLPFIPVKKKETEKGPGYIRRIIPVTEISRD